MLIRAPGGRLHARREGHLDNKTSETVDWARPSPKKDPRTAKTYIVASGRVVDIRGTRPGAPKCQWHEWLGGSIWELHNGEDFEGIESPHFASMIYNAARAREKSRVAVRDNGDTIILQSFDPE